jgi:lipid-binding SYLF domain-containing protein
VGSKRLLIIAAASMLALNFYTSASSGQIRTGKTKPTDEAVRAGHAAAVLSEITEAPDHGIPEAVLKKAYGIAIIPHVLKDAFGIGGRYGKGLVAQKKPDGGWELPLFIQIGGGNVGLQPGVEATDVVMIFTNRDGIRPLLRDKLKIGADVLVHSAIYSYSRTKGLFARIAMDGAVVQLDNNANKNVYGKKSLAVDVSVLQVSAAAMGVVQPFLRALQK